MDILATHRAPVISAVTPTNAHPSPAENRELIQAVKAVNQAELFGSGNELSFTMDRDSKRPVIRIVDRTTKEVIRQLPPEYLLRMAQDLSSGDSRTPELGR
jgi:flagellar protein FlaG